MEYVQDYMSGVVRPKLLYDVAKKFVTKPLLVEEGIQRSSHWHFHKANKFDKYKFCPADEEFDTNNAIYETLHCGKGIRMAPAEGHKPTSILFNPNA